MSLSPNGCLLVPYGQMASPANTICPCYAGRNSWASRWPFFRLSHLFLPVSSGLMSDDHYNFLNALCDVLSWAFPVRSQQSCYRWGSFHPSFHTEIKRMSMSGDSPMRSSKNSLFIYSLRHSYGRGQHTLEYSKWLHWSVWICSEKPFPNCSLSLALLD